MTKEIPSLAKLKPNPQWAKLPLFDRKGWKRFRFDDIVENVNERVEPSTAAAEIYVGLDDLDSGSLHIRRWGKGSDVIGTKLRFRKGDIIFGRRRAYQRKLAVAEVDGICSAHAMVARAKPKVVLPEFLPFLMMSDKFMSRAVDISVGSLSPTINWTTLKLEEFDLPPLDQQRRIAEILWAVDESSVANEKAVQTAGEAVNAKLADALGTGGAGKSAARYPIKSLCEVVFLQTGIAKGKTCPATVQTVELPYLRVANVQDGYLDLTEMKTIIVPKVDEERFKLQDGDVVICEGGDFDKVGRGTIWRNQVSGCLHQNHVFSLRANRSVLLPEFLALQLGSAYGKKYFLGCAKKTSNLASINSTQVKAFPFQLPKLAEQELIVREVKKLQSVKDALAAKYDATRKLLNAFTEALT
ncbi:MAG: restriction endonuclease subunit S [Verrucomicrobiota bacterium]